MHHGLQRFKISSRGQGCQAVCYFSSSLAIRFEPMVRAIFPFMLDVQVMHWQTPRQHVFSHKKVSLPLSDVYTKILCLSTTSNPPSNPSVDRSTLPLNCHMQSGSLWGVKVYSIWELNATSVLGRVHQLPSRTTTIIVHTVVPLPQATSNVSIFIIFLSFVFLINR